MKIVAENIPEDRNEVLLGEDGPVAHFEDHSDYAKKALAEVPGELLSMLDQISPVQDYRLDAEIAASEGHIVGTTVMSADPEDGVVDEACAIIELTIFLWVDQAHFPAGRVPILP